MAGTVSEAAVAPVEPTPGRVPPLLLDALVALTAGIVSILVALWKVGGPSALSGLWAHWDPAVIYSFALAMARQLWITPNYDFGFPFVQDLAYAAPPDLLPLATLKAIALFSNDPLVTVNLYQVLGFGSIAVAAYALFRLVRQPRWLAFALAISLTLLPWHFDRFKHPFLANYSPVLVGLIIVVAVASWNLGFAGPNRGRARDLLLVLVLGIYVGLSGPYYAAFISILAVVTIAFQIVVGRRGRDLLPAVWLALVPLIVAQVASYSYRVLAVTPAPAAGVFDRTPEESQLFGGAFFTLFRTAPMWSEGLTVPGLQYVPILNSNIEGDALNSTVGLIAVIVSFVVCGIVLVRNGPYRRGRLVRDVTYWPWLFMVSVLFFASGGFGQVFSIVFLNQIRSWGRFSIVVIAIAYVILGILAARWIARSRRRSLVTGVVAAAVLAVTALDVITMPPVIDNAVASREADELRDLGRQIDAAVPAGCGVFELPAYSYPEGLPADGIPTYEPILPALFSDNARWSYGGIRGTEAGNWSVEMVSRNLGTLIQQTKAVDFCAILVDRAAYSATGDDPTPALRAALGDPIATSASGRWELYSLASATAGSFTRDYVLDPVRVTFGFGFGPGPEYNEHHTIATITGARATLFLANPRTAAASGAVEFEARGVDCAATLTTSTAQGAVQTALAAAATTVRVPAAVGGDSVSAVHLTVSPACSITSSTGVQIIDPRFIPDQP